MVSTTTYSSSGCYKKLFATGNNRNNKLFIAGSNKLFAAGNNSNNKPAAE
jgi:hypothetical protein